MFFVPLQPIDTMDAPPQSSRVFTISETKQLLAILMAPRTQTLFKDHKQHGTVWNYVYKCMKAKLPRFAKNTRQCYKKYENLKGKYYELKRAEMNGEQRPQWLYWKEMDYIVNQMPSHKLRTNLDHRISHLNNNTSSSSSTTTTTLKFPVEQNRSTASVPELRDTKPLRLSTQSQDSMATRADTANIRLLGIIRDTIRAAHSSKTADCWETALQRAHTMGIYPNEKTWVDLYYEVWMVHLELTIAKWQEFASGRKVVRYDEADQIMFDIIKDEYNDFNTGTNVRIPTLKTLPAFIDKIKELKTYLVMDEADSLLNNDESMFNSSDMAALLANGGPIVDTNDIPNNYENGAADTPPTGSTDDTNFSNDNEILRLRQKQMFYKAQFIKTKMDAYVEKHQRKCYKMDLELYKIEKDLGLPPSDFTRKFFAQQQQQQQGGSESTVSAQQTIATTSNCNDMEMNRPNNVMQSVASNVSGMTTPLPQISLVNGGHCSMNNSVFLPDINIKREINFDDGSHFDFI